MSNDNVKSSLPDGYMIFSKRSELGKELDRWCTENGARKCGMNYIAALQAEGFKIVSPESEREPPKSKDSK